MSSPASVVWDDTLLGYDMGGEHPMNPVRLQLTLRLAGWLGVLRDVPMLAPEPADDSQLERVHLPAYLEAVRRAPAASWDVGHGLGTADNPVFADMHEASALVAGGSLLGAECIAKGVTRRAVSLAGGLHHAMPDHAAGFCVYNDCAVAIAWLLDNGFDRIAYIDTDVHHGDGVQTAFYGDKRVLTISLHEHPRTLWPGTGYPHEIGTDGAEGTSVNVALNAGTTDPQWLRAFHAVVPGLIRSFRPQILVTQCGVDSHRWDPLADLALTVDGHRAIYQALRALAEEYTEGRWLALGGGGYDLLRVVPRSWTHLLAIALDRDIDPQAALPPEWNELSGHLAPGVPLPTRMTDDSDTAFQPWSGDTTEQVDESIAATRQAVYPLHGLDPEDPRD